MLVNPGAYFYWNGQVLPVSKNEYYMFGKLADCEAILKLLQENFPASNLQLVSGTLTGQTDGLFLPPNPNPFDIDIWLIQGTIPGQDASGNPIQLTFDEYAGWLADRGSPTPPYGGKPTEVDSNGAYGPGWGGPCLTYSNVDGTDAQARWSVTQAPVLKYVP